MNANKHVLKGLGGAALLLGASLAWAETVTVPATVTVNNAIDFTFTGTLDFGTVRATANAVADECAVLSLPANPANPLAAATDTDLCPDGAGTSVIQPVGGTPSRPVFTIAGVAPFTTMNVAIPMADDTATAIPLVAALPPGSSQFFVGKFSAYRTSGTPGTIIAAGAGTGTIQTNASGTATFTVGALLTTDNGSPTVLPYEDGVPYTGTFDVTVTY